jgi:opacity protein-like surface antigen
MCSLILCLVVMLMLMCPAEGYAQSQDDGSRGEGTTQETVGGVPDEGGYRGSAPAEVQPEVKTEAQPAEEEPSTSVFNAPTKDGFYIGYGITKVDIGGDFDGVSAQVGGGSGEIQPEMDKGNGYKIKLGGQAKQGMFEINYEKSKHDAQWGGVEWDECTFSSINIDGFLLILDNTYRVRPFIGIGIGFTTLKIPNGSMDGYGDSETAKFRGIDFRFGGGAQIRATRNIVADLVYMYRYGSYDSVDGIVSGDLDDPIDGDGPTMSVELKYIF